MTYVGVEFPNNGGISIVNSCWLTPLKREVYWPPKQTGKNFKKLLRSVEDPPQDGTWKVHQIHRIFFETDDYDDAEKKIRKAEETSNLESDVEEQSQLLTKRKRKSILYSSDELSESEIDSRNKTRKQLSRPPPILNFYRTDREDFEDSSLPSSQRHQTRVSPPRSLQRRQFMASSPQSSHHSQSFFVRSSPLSSCHDQSNILNNRVCGKANSQTQQSPLCTETIIGTPQNSIRCSPASINNETILNQTTEGHGGGSKEKFKENKIADLLKTVIEQNNQILNWIRKQDRPVDNTFALLPDDVGVDFPLKTEQDLQVVETYIDNKNNFLSLSSYLSKLGGRDFTAHTNSILKFLLTSSLAANLNFFGKRGQKRAFNDLKLRGIVVCSVRKTSPHVTEKEIDDKIKIWLKHAPEKLKREQNGNP